MLRTACATLLCVALLLACREPSQTAPRAPAQDAPAAPAQDAPAAPAALAPGAESIFLAIGGETFTLELALVPSTRLRGLGGRPALSSNAGMLFVFRSPRQLAMVMRDCPAAIDVAFLDAQGRVVGVHSMPAEPPRRPDESPLEYERRLPIYASGAPAQFAIEVAGGRLAQLGVGVGAQLAFDTQGLAARAR